VVDHVTTIPVAKALSGERHHVAAFFADMAAFGRRTYVRADAAIYKPMDDGVREQGGSVKAFTGAVWRNRRAGGCAVAGLSHGMGDPRTPRRLCVRDRSQILRTPHMRVDINSGLAL
jgi:hypothetical protein